VLLLLVFAAGCGGGDALPRERVSGKVTLDGKPLPTGSIQFLPEGGGDARNPALSAGATINEGDYDIPRQSGLLPGNYKVTISAAAGGAAAPANEAPGPAQAPAQDIVPEKYNKDSTLTAEVKAGGENTFNFDLTSK
jgi:hypothetical protein